MRNIINLILLAPLLILAACAEQSGMQVALYSVDADGVQEEIGIITPVDTPKGLKLYVDASGIPEGMHGFHVHQNPSCEPMPDAQGKPAAALGAGGHFDPENTAKHLGPHEHGHKGDLPPLQADANGNIKMDVIAPRLTLKDIQGRALIIHAGADNFSDSPAPLGGGGARIACAIIP